MVEKIQNLENHIIENKIAGDHPIFTEMMNLTRSLLGRKLENEPVIANDITTHKLHILKTNEGITEMFLRVLACVQQGQLITEAVRNNGMNCTVFHKAINLDQKQILISAKKTATFNRGRKTKHN